MRVQNARRLALLLALSMAALMLMPGISTVAALPGAIVMRSGGRLELPATALMRASLAGDAADMAFTGGGVRLTAGDVGTARLTYSLLGMLPVRTVNVSVEPEVRLIPGGQSVGIAIDTAGVIVVGASDLGATPSPARAAGIKAGDIIQSVDGAAIDSADALSEHLSDGNAVTLGLIRDGAASTCVVVPALDERDGCWRLGAWVRDSTAGVGTLTFIDPETGAYGALGHAITDADTSVTLPVGTGELYANQVVDVTPSVHGRPGELTGDFIFSPNAVGTVELNTPRGIFGTAEAAGEGLYPEGLPAARQGEAHPGAATLLTTIDEGGVREYACEIVRLNERGGDARSLVLRITDLALLERTGGIVQGMSGSPILQDGRLIGAVTHVMINDPAMGYGIGIERMLEEARKLRGA